MACTLSNKCAKNLSKRTVLLQLIIKNVVTCFLEHSVDFLSVSPSHNYPPLLLNSPPSNHLLSLSNCLIPKYQYLISIVLPHLPHSRNLFLFFLINLIIFSLLLLPHLMNSSSLVTLTSTLVIFLITLPLSFFLFCHHSTYRNMLISQLTIRIIFLTW